MVMIAMMMAEGGIGDDVGEEDGRLMSE